MEKENLYELSNEAQEAAKRTAWPIESLRDTYAFGYETAKDIYQIRIASLEAQLEKARGIIEVVVEVKDEECWYDHHG